jgi:hypothetical protein
MGVPALEIGGMSSTSLGQPFLGRAITYGIFRTFEN